MIGRARVDWRECERKEKKNEEGTKEMSQVRGEEWEYRNGRNTGRGS
jgi:hypothetical protein